MTVAALDMLEFVETLEFSGFAREQSKGMVDAFKKAQDAQLKELATKGDMVALKGDMASFKGDLEMRIAEIKGELILIKWMLAMVIAATVLPALKTLLG
ncbi:MAG: hypothetical protein H7833_01010 [Magnetococcus sp. DMHC-1]